MNNKTAAIYIRVSTIDQAKEGYSLDAQERSLREYCKTHGYTLYKVYIDPGISGKSMAKRPAMQEMLSDADHGLFNIIVVWKLTRFARNLSELLVTCDRLDKKKIQLISYFEAFDCSTASGKMVRNMLGTIAEFEREVISENVIAAMAERAVQGKRTCSYVLGYDNKGKDDMVINEAEASQVAFIFDSYLIYKNLSQVAELCKEKGYNGKNGRPPKPESIRKILTRPIYCGYYTFRGELYKGNYTPIVSVKTYNKVQSILRAQGRAYGRPCKDFPQKLKGG